MTTKDSKKFNFKQIKPSTYLWIISSVISVLYIFIFAFSLGDMKKSKVTYDDLVYMELTVENVRKSHSDGEYIYNIEVAELNGTLRVGNLHAVGSTRAMLNSLNEGDKIYCYIDYDNGRYNAAEIKTAEKTVLSLEDYTSAYRRNAITGFTAVPAIYVLFMISLALRTRYFAKNSEEASKDHGEKGYDIQR